MGVSPLAEIPCVLSAGPRLSESQEQDIRGWIAKPPPIDHKGNVATYEGGTTNIAFRFSPTSLANSEPETTYAEIQPASIVPSGIRLYYLNGAIYIRYSSMSAHPTAHGHTSKKTAKKPIRSFDGPWAQTTGSGRPP